MLFSILAIISATINYKAFDKYMASRLFKIKKPKDQLKKDEPYFLQSNYIKLGNLPNFKLLLRALIPK